MEESPPIVSVSVTDRVQRRRAAAKRQRGSMRVAWRAKRPDATSVSELLGELLSESR